mmetsp:Transcript_4698/g.7302  ORF Transcript_4698/g.7302 Transcript_4698/m.7302 type:complete len:217 (+) Transcript_4698:1831-2481(+)
MAFFAFSTASNAAWTLPGGAATTGFTDGLSSEPFVATTWAAILETRAEISDVDGADALFPSSSSHLRFLLSLRSGFTIPGSSFTVIGASESVNLLRLLSEAPALSSFFSDLNTLSFDSCLPSASSFLFSSSSFSDSCFLRRLRCFSFSLPLSFSRRSRPRSRSLSFSFLLSLSTSSSGEGERLRERLLSLFSDLLLEDRVSLESWRSLVSFFDLCR